MSEARASSQKTAILIALGAGVLMVGTFFVVWMMRPRVDPFPADAWGPRSVGRVTLDAPFAFKHGPRVALPPAVAQVVERMDVMANINTNADTETIVSTILYRPEVQGSLDGAVEGAMQDGANTGKTASQRRKVSYDVQKYTLDGLAARRARYAGDKLHIEGIFAQDGQTLIFVTVIYRTPEHRKEAKRILDSVKIAKR
jgi:hypothetical protein